MTPYWASIGRGGFLGSMLGRLQYLMHRLAHDSNNIDLRAPYS